VRWRRILEKSRQYVQDVRKKLSIAAEISGEGKYIIIKTNK